MRLGIVKTWAFQVLGYEASGGGGVTDESPGWDEAPQEGMWVCRGEKCEPLL
jgi:hypothetical protein